MTIYTGKPVEKKDEESNVPPPEVVEEPLMVNIGVQVAFLNRKLYEVEPIVAVRFKEPSQAKWNKIVTICTQFVCTMHSKTNVVKHINYIMTLLGFPCAILEMQGG